MSKQKPKKLPKRQHRLKHQGKMLDEIMPRREEARRAGDTVKSHAMKILMNSFYCVLATYACRYPPDLLSFPTPRSSHLARRTRRRIAV